MNQIFFRKKEPHSCGMGFKYFETYSNERKFKIFKKIPFILRLFFFNYANTLNVLPTELYGLEILTIFFLNFRMNIFEKSA